MEAFEIPGSDCKICKHQWGYKRCDAYPEEIPDDIFGNWVKHREVREDQEGN